jgi:DNA polymerase-3 subunit epsilon
VSALAGRTLIAVDTETTGMNPADGARLVEVARVPIVDGVLAQGWSSLINPGVRIPPDATRVHGITDAMVAQEPRAAEVGGALRVALADLPLVFHNARCSARPALPNSRTPWSTRSGWHAGCSPRAGTRLAP